MPANPLALDHLEVTALHEAGHVTVALAVGAGVEGVDLLPRPGGVRGRTYVDLPKGLSSLDLLALYMAGDWAVSLAKAGMPYPQRPRALPWRWDWLARAKREEQGEPGPEVPTDGQRVRKVDPSAADLHAAGTHAGELLTANWSTVRALAGALMAEGTLGEDRIRELGKGVTGRGGPGASVLFLGPRNVDRSRPSPPTAPAPPAGGWRMLQEPPRRRPPGPPPGRRLVRSGVVWL